MHKSKFFLTIIRNSSHFSNRIIISCLTQYSSVKNDVVTNFVGKFSAAYLTLFAYYDARDAEY